MAGDIVRCGPTTPAGSGSPDSVLALNGDRDTGLVLDRTAVVIGAMLVSPLMGPVLEFGMGIAVGSSLLALQPSPWT